MTKYGSTAICDSCGRNVHRSTQSHAKSSDSDYSFTDILGLLGIAGAASYAAKKLDSSNTSAICQHSIDKRSDSFDTKFKRFARNTLYSTVAFLFILAGFSFLYFCLERSFGKAVPFYLSILSGLILIWGGCLVFAIKGRDGYTAKNILGSVSANITLKIAGMLLMFAKFDFLVDINFALRVVIGVCLFIAGHYVYKEIKDS